MRGKPAEVGNSHSGYENLTQLLGNPDTVSGAADHVVALAKKTQQLPSVLEMATGDRPIPPFLIRVLRMLLNSEDVSKPHELVRANWSIIQDVLEKEEDSESFETFLKALPGLDNLVTGIIDGIFDDRESGLYLALLRTNTNTNFIAWCAAGLPSVSRDTWARGIQPQGRLGDLAIELKARGANIALGRHLL